MRCARQGLPPKYQMRGLDEDVLYQCGLLSEKLLLLVQGDSLILQNSFQVSNE